MLSYVAQEYASKMLAVFLEDATTRFGTHNIGNDFTAWMELEKAGIVHINADRTLAILDTDAILHDAFPDEPE